MELFGRKYKTLRLVQTQHSMSAKEHHPPYEVRWWQPHVMGMFLISSGWGTCQDRREKWMEQNTEKSSRKNLLPSARKLKLGLKFIFQHDNDPKHPAKSTMEWLRNKKVNVLEWPSEIPDLNLIENLWHDLKIAVHQHSLHNLAELEQFYTEEWANIAQSTSANLVETYPNSCNCWHRSFHQVLTQGMDTYQNKIL